MPSSRTVFHADSGISLSALNREWLLVGLKNAGRIAGSESWWLLDDVATAIWTSLRRENLQAALSLAAFDEMVKTVLFDIGYHEVALAFRSDHPKQRISLLELIANPPLRSESDFYAKLQMAILALHQRGVQDFHLTDLLSCTTEFQPASEMFAWSTPSVTRARVVKFVRRQIRSLHWPQSIRCLIS